jgi:hypothetical protein
MTLDERTSRPERRDTVGYEPPRVERVLTPGELEREVLFAGQPTTPFT